MKAALSAVVVGLVLAAACAAPASDASLDPEQPYGGKLSDPVTYQVDLQYVVTAPYRTKVLKVWLPLPPSDAIQTVTGRELSAFPNDVKPVLGKEMLYGNEFACFTFENPEGAQIVRHKFTVKTHEVRWGIEPAKVARVGKWPASFDKFLRGEKLIVVDDRVGKLAREIATKQGQLEDLSAVMQWIQANIAYDHSNASLQASALHALEQRAGHCSDFHGLCAALSRSLGYPTRVAYGINPWPKASPSHCKLEAFLPGHGWVPFDVSETQQLVKRIQADPKLDDARKKVLVERAHKRLISGFRDNTWFLQTRGTDYDLAPPASKKVAVVRTIYAEADGVALPEPDPSSSKQREFSWMSAHRYEASRAVVSPFKDYRSLE